MPFKLNRNIEPRFRLIAQFGFFSGLPFALCNNTLQAWLAEAGISPAEIGLFTLIALPGIFKFLWSPLLVRFRPPFLGRQRGWMFIGQILIAVMVVLLGMQSPNTALGAVALLAFGASLVGTAFDISYAGYRSDLLARHELTTGASYNAMGYRVALLVAGALAMILSGYIGWRNTYWLMGAVIFMGAVATLRAPDPRGQSVQPASLTDAFLPPLREFVTRDKALPTALFIVLFAFGDLMTFTMMPVYFIQGAHFSVAEYGFVSKVMGSIALLAGIALSGRIVNCLGTFRTLLLIAALQVLSHILLITMVLTGKSLVLMVAVVLLSNMMGAINSVLWSSYLLGLCDPRYPSTQYALVSALAGSTRVAGGPIAGLLAAHAGWLPFFAMNILFDIPGICLVIYLRRHFAPHAGAAVAKSA